MNVRGLQDTQTDLKTATTQVSHFIGLNSNNALSNINILAMMLRSSNSTGVWHVLACKPKAV